MNKFTTLKSIPAYLPIANIDTDMIIPKQFLKTIKRTGLGDNLFYEMRYDNNGKKISDFISSGIEWLPTTKIALNKEKTRTVIDFLEALENDEDVQHVYANLETKNNLKEKSVT